MPDRHWQIGVCGTFDVANYGDLLFPLIAESELRERLGAVTLHRFSYGTRTPPHWPYEVTSIAALPDVIRRLDGLLIGGGFLIRFDKQVAPGYTPPDPAIHHPTGYWLTPALLALQHDVPLMWNAPGMHCNEIPAWANPLVKMALSLSRYVSVRDEPTGAALARIGETPVTVVPDTAFRISRLLNLDGFPSVEFARLRDTSGLDGPYIVVQATLGVDGFVRFVKRHATRLAGVRFLALPIGPVMGEHSALVDDLPGVVRLREWPDPLVIAELIGRSAAVVGHSYHLCVTALASGVPVFTPQDLTKGKYTALQQCETIFSLPTEDEPDPDRFLSRVGRTAPSAAARATHGPLSEHWDRIAAAIRMDAPKTSVVLNRFWQTLPTVLEDAALRHDGVVLASETRLAEANARVDTTMALLSVAHAEAASTRARLHETTAQLGLARAEAAEAHARFENASNLLSAARSQGDETGTRLDEALKHLDVARSDSLEIQQRLDETAKRLAAADAQINARDSRIAEIGASTSWRLTAPVRFVGHRLRWRSRAGR
jgi:lipopolysaccharide transport system ATP-binding protein